jgi:hypothetical protein
MVKKNNKIIFGKGGNDVLPLHSQTARKCRWRSCERDKVHKNK